jgi:hypothetical protein
MKANRCRWKAKGPSLVDPPCNHSSRDSAAGFGTSLHFSLRWRYQRRAGRTNVALIRIIPINPGRLIPTRGSPQFTNTTNYNTFRQSCSSCVNFFVAARQDLRLETRDCLLCLRASPGCEDPVTRPASTGMNHWRLAAGATRSPKGSQRGCHFVQPWVL